mmetsp:Transcript_38805/g.109792  ORF Transcript_38805/g.109792 Transcript_38805/m.109792 type:complete len:479 (-) Transcript_38805:1419-2855(-)
MSSDVKPEGLAGLLHLATTPPPEPCDAKREPLLRRASGSPGSSGSGGRSDANGLRSRTASVATFLHDVGDSPETPPRVRRLLTLADNPRDRTYFGFTVPPTGGACFSRLLCVALVVLCALGFVLTFAIGRDALCQALPGAFFCTAGPRFTPLPRDDSDAIFSSGSLFGHLYINMECPSVRPHEIPPEPHDDFDLHYTPSTVFPVGRVVPAGRSALAVSSGDLPDGTSDRTTLLVGVLSGCTAAEERQVARDTWMRLAVPKGTSWRAVFLLSYKCADELRDEQELYGDLLFFHTQESYYALTPKVLEFFEYANQVGAQYTMKTDDDTFVFINRILAELQHMPDTCLYWGSKSQLPWMDKYKGSGLDVPLNKWYIQKDDYRVLAGTRYMAGGGYILSQDLVEKVVKNKGKFPLADRLPEDASLGRAVGDDAFEQCACHDSRFIHSITAFQHVQLFHPGLPLQENLHVRSLRMAGQLNSNH